MSHATGKKATRKTQIKSAKAETTSKDEIKKHTPEGLITGKR